MDAPSSATRLSSMPESATSSNGTCSHSATSTTPSTSTDTAGSSTELPSTCRRSGLPKATGVPDRKSNTSELQSLRHLVCRLLLEKKKQHSNRYSTTVHSLC